MIRLTLIAAALAAPLHAAPVLAAEVAPVAGFDAARYLGRWHEVASIPAWFQRDCASDTTATYALTPEGELDVLNACRTAEGVLKQAEGRARFTQSPDVGALEVAFFSILGLWVWPVAGDYVVIALDPDYRWSAVAHPSRDYGWILAREPSLDTETLHEIAAHFEAAGYDACTLLMAAETPGDARRPLCEAAR